jgi:histidine triad (HIT) family protein
MGMETTEPTIFTKIIRGEIPSYKIYEDDKTFAFLDIHPIQPGHVLVVTKEPVDHIWDLDEATYAHLMSVVKKLALHIRTKMGTKRVASQIVGTDVPHCHVHLIPINTGADFHVKPSEGEPDHEALAEIAKKLMV